MAKARESKKASFRSPEDLISREGECEWTLVIGVKPGQSRCFLRRGELEGGAPSWIVGVKEPAREGRANAGVVRAVAGFLGIAPSSVTIVSGQGSRIKRLAIAGLTETEGIHRLMDASDTD